MMGSGGMIVLDEDNCMVDIAKFYLGFTVSESCGKCTPCRIGTKRMLEILEKISAGRGEIEDLDKLDELAHYIQARSSRQSSTSEMSMKHTSSTRDVLQASARHCSTT